MRAFRYRERLKTRAGRGRDWRIWRKGRIGFMSAVLSVKERIVQAIEAGESNFREFKTAWHGVEGAKAPRNASTIRKDIGEALVSFANADGGMLLVGVEDDGTVTGVPHSAGEIETFLRAPVSNV